MLLECCKSQGHIVRHNAAGCDRLLISNDLMSSDTENAATKAPRRAFLLLPEQLTTSYAPEAVQAHGCNAARG